MESPTPARRCCGCGSTHARPAAMMKDSTTMKFTVPDMTCGHCVSTVTRAIKALDAKAEVQADLDSKIVSVETSAPAGAISKALDEAGYPNTAA